MKPCEETWTINTIVDDARIDFPDYRQAFFSQPLVDGTYIYFDTTTDEDRARVKLAAAAPDMARALLELETCNGPGSLPYQTDKGRYERLIAALKKAGIEVPPREPSAPKDCFVYETIKK